MSTRMRYAVLGAGGIGGYYAARLLLHGDSVTLIARGAHLQALQSGGLSVRHPDFELAQDVEAYDLPTFVRLRRPSEFDLVIVCVKAMHTVSVAETLAPWLRSEHHLPRVLSLQNGVDNEDQLAQGLGSNCVLGGLAVRIGAHLVEPGKIEAVGPGQVVLGAYRERGMEKPPSQEEARHPTSLALSTIQRAFCEAGIPTRVTGDIRRELWRKLVINNGVNPLSALTGLDTRALSHHVELGPLVYRSMQEAARAAAADGVQLGDDDCDEMFRLIREFDPIKTSMLVDAEQGRALEVEEIGGAVLARSARLSLDAPCTRMAYALLRQRL